MIDSTNRVKQAVILAGGRGTRLWPLTAAVAKPMIRFHGKPFLHYLMDQLKEQGFEKVLLLLGYLAETIQSYFGSGEDFGIRIEYSISKVDNGTGRRLFLAKEKLDPVFLLMYCDNYWPMNIDAMQRQFVDMDADAQITVYANRDGYSRSNVRVDEQNRVTSYDRSRKEKGLNGVEIGYSLIKREVINRIPNENVNFEETVYPFLVSRRLLSAYLTEHKYYSIGSHERLPLTEEFLARRPAVILDRDGVLNRKPPKAEYVRSWASFEWLPGAKEAVRLLKKSGYRVIIATNQAGIARGHMGRGDLAGIHRGMEADLAQIGASIDKIYFCPHGWDEGCECRKPGPGMLFKAQNDFQLDLPRTVFIGDDDRDEQAGIAAGCKVLTVTPGASLLDLVREHLNQG